MSASSPVRSRHRIALRWTVRAFVVALLAVLALVALVYFSQHAMLYHPRPYDDAYANSLPPDGVELRFNSTAGNQVAFYLPRGLDRQLPQRIWVAFSGNGSLALGWAGLISQDRQAGDAFLLIDYPGYGKSEGYATIASTRAVADKALEALAEHLSVTEDKIEPLLNVLGHSLGAAVALDFAARHPVQRIVLVAPFTTLREEAATAVGPLSCLLIENYDNRVRLRELSRHSPPPRIDIFHGTKDDIIPVRMGRELADSFPGFVTFHPLEGEDHISPLFNASGSILAAMNR